tara:strand:+ start:218 stop:742 length:525 start_codon:yes stop_codon:yes gene_type:complete
MSSVVPTPFVEIAHKIKELTKMKVKDLNMVREQYNFSLPRREKIRQGKNLKEKRFNLISFCVFEKTPISIRISPNDETLYYDSLKEIIPDEEKFKILSKDTVLKVWFQYEVIKELYIDCEVEKNITDIAIELQLYLKNFIQDVDRLEEKFKNFPDSVRETCFLSEFRRIKPRLH